MDMIEPGMISKKCLDEFQKIYFEEFGVKLSDEEATKAAIDLLNLMRVITKPLPEEAKK